MTSFLSDNPTPGQFNVKVASEAMRIELYRMKCAGLMTKWHCLLDYTDLDEWFDTNRCCLPISLSRLIDKRTIKAYTTLQYEN